MFTDLEQEFSDRPDQSVVPYWRRQVRGGIGGRKYKYSTDLAEEKDTHFSFKNNKPSRFNFFISMKFYKKHTF